MSICLLVIDDGRGHLEKCLESCARYLPPMDACVMVDDSDHELGFAGAIRAGWEAVLETGCKYVFHLESDFRFLGTPPLTLMQEVAAMPDVAQISLKRGAVNRREREAGGIVEADPEHFTDWPEYGCTMHRRYFTTNPSLYETALCERGWPQEPLSEGIFTHKLLADGLRFAIVGAPLARPKVQHRGSRRAGHGY